MCGATHLPMYLPVPTPVVCHAKPTYLPTYSSNCPSVPLWPYHHASSSHPASDWLARYSPQDTPDRHRTPACSWPRNVTDPPDWLVGWLVDRYIHTKNAQRLSMTPPSFLLLLLLVQSPSAEQQLACLPNKRKRTRPTYRHTHSLTTIANQGQSLLSVNLCQASWH